MELFATAIRASACSAVYWEEEAETGGAVRSRAVWRIQQWMKKERDVYKRQAYAELQNSVASAAKRGYVDTVIDAQDTRDVYKRQVADVRVWHRQEERIRLVWMMPLKRLQK